MDDFQIGDPRKSSAQKIKTSMKGKRRKRTFGQYLFDLLVKTLILFLLLALDFTLFANSGNYNLFLSAVEPMPEAVYIYIGLAGLSFVLMFFASLFKFLENIVISLAVSLLSIALINQFATFDKSSGLLILLNGLVSDEINALLYEYAFLIIGTAVFILTWILLSIFSRSFLFYLFLLLAALTAWILSEAYFNTSLKYFRVVASSPALRSESVGKNLVFLTFRNLTTPNNLQKMAKDSKNSPAVESSLKKTLGFYVNNKFVLYPNAMQQNPQDSFVNLIASYNPEAKDKAASYVQNTAIRDGYFNFEALQTEKKFMRQNSLYEMLRKGGYSITVYQPSDIDTCYVNNKLAVSVCKEKVSVPMTMSSEYFSVVEKTWLLFSQWLISTGFVPSLDPVLKALEYVYPLPELSPLGFKADKVSVVNSFKALDQIAEGLDNQNGNQAYFAVIDLPSETYVYDEFCQMKPMTNWSSERDETGRKSIDMRRQAYAEQVSCLYGSLEKFMQQLENSGMLSNTTIVIEGLNNPLGLNKPENDYYAQLQSKNQVSVAVRQPNTQRSKLDYSVCAVSEILNSVFFTHKPCQEFEGMTMAEKLAAEVKKQVEDQKYTSSFLTDASQNFREWFDAWGIKNQFGSSSSESKHQKTVYENVLEMIDDVKNDDVIDSPSEDASEADTSLAESPEERFQNEEETEPVIEVEDITEQAETPTIDVPVDQKTVGEDVVPDTLYDAVKEIQQTEAEAVIDRAKRSLEIKAQRQIQEEKKQRQVENAAAEAKAAARKNVAQVKTNSAEIYRDVLEAPVADGKGLSPEELKKQYHEILKKTGTLDVKTIEN